MEFSLVCPFHNSQLQVVTKLKFKLQISILEISTYSNF